MIGSECIYIYRTVPYLPRGVRRPKADRSKRNRGLPVLAALDRPAEAVEVVQRHSVDAQGLAQETPPERAQERRRQRPRCSGRRGPLDKTDANASASARASAKPNGKGKGKGKGNGKGTRHKAKTYPQEEEKGKGRRKRKRKCERKRKRKCKRKRRTRKIRGRLT